LYEVVFEVEKKPIKRYNIEDVAEDKEYLSFGQCVFGKLVVWVSFKKSYCDWGNWN
jgi:hypothetical protein